MASESGRPVLNELRLSGQVPRPLTVRFAQAFTAQSVSRFR